MPGVASSLIGAGIANIQVLVGTSTGTTLVGPNTVNAWQITGANSGNLNGTLAFTVVQTLTGGTGADTFSLFSGGSITTINGMAGANTLDYTSYPGPVTVNLQTLSFPGVAAVSSIQAINGTGAAEDSLVGPNLNNSWTITGANTGAVGSVSFSAFANLTGGSMNDTFNFKPVSSVSGTIDGKAGTNTLNFTAYGQAVTVLLQTKSAAAVGSFANIGMVTGSTVASTLIGPNTVNTWVISGSGFRYRERNELPGLSHAGRRHGQ